MPSGLEEARRHLLPVAAELLEASKKLSDEKRSAVGAYLKTIMGVFVRYARGEGTKDSRRLKWGRAGRGCESRPS